MAWRKHQKVARVMLGENGAPKLAAVIADVAEGRPDAIPSDPSRRENAEPPKFRPGLR
jgi:hypothetical protein